MRVPVIFFCLTVSLTAVLRPVFGERRGGINRPQFKVPALDFSLMRSSAGESELASPMSPDSTTEFALKVSNRSFSTGELEVLKELCSKGLPFVMKFEEAVECPSWTDMPDDTTCLVLDLASGGEVYDRMGKASSEELYHCWAHRDIKPVNLFLDDQDRIVIGDVGIADKMMDKGGKKNVISASKGTHAYLSPEGHGCEYGQCGIDEDSSDFQEGWRVDIFAAGISFFKMCSGDDRVHPWEAAMDLSGYLFSVQSEEAQSPGEAARKVKEKERADAEKSKKLRAMMAANDSRSSSFLEDSGSRSNSTVLSPKTTPPSFLQRLSLAHQRRDKENLEGGAKGGAECEDRFGQKSVDNCFKFCKKGRGWPVDPWSVGQSVCSNMRSLKG
uniref:Protein kinase domain-containing protein n=1 Tax=Chromera velia CCMP2878 TaxID=1169474 RepID=A0A0G4GDG4_9ALVE|eukprot:Cvel_21395.t1-p1 / transcript=Cvel_21395.t1 / gene=Cvel_21395 / organism=Chromera_velia_CCMP2878 / gene_product=G protein-coupled receptor kinase 1, putative / transcript_product=G protein-coupled receptor kinase 1, putative / location=Cvel_scaffold2003:18040-22280(+) / protein_length=385 / sequence_SO=supercontig / SO=protein_coding / is_pseudo=false